jgi:hypothetical protein
VLALALIFAGGCTTARGRMSGATPVVQLEEIPRSQYHILGPVEGHGKVGHFLCIRFGDGQFAYVSEGVGSAVGLGAIAVSRDAVAAATYDAISKMPDADFVLPLTTNYSRSGIPCFNSERATVRGKAIRIDPD